MKPLHLVGFPELNKISIAETDTEYSVYCSNNTESSHPYTIILPMAYTVWYTVYSCRCHRYLEKDTAITITIKIPSEILSISQDISDYSQRVVFRANLIIIQYCEEMCAANLIFIFIITVFNIHPLQFTGRRYSIKKCVFNCRFYSFALKIYIWI